MSKRFLSPLFALAAAAGLSACAANWDMDAVSALPDTGSAFQAGLHKEYVALARSEASEGDWTDASFFNTLGENAAKAMAFGPQDIAARDLPDTMVAPMTAARSKLVAALAAGADRQPAIAARAQAMFDCWMQEQEENFQPKDIAKCKGDFEAALAKLKPGKPMAKGVASFVVYFGFNADTLSAAAMNTVNDAAAYAKANTGKLIVLKGHTDSAGDTAYNNALSERRAAATAAALSTAGVNGDRIHREGHGEYDLMVKTDDGVQEGKNRRVTIGFSK